MGLFSRKKAAPEARSVLDFSAFSDLLNVSNAGVSVTEENSVALPAVYRCVTLNADTVSCLPIDVVRKQGETRIPVQPPAWLTEPNDAQDTQQFLHMVQTSLDLNGNAFLLKASGAGGRLEGLEVLPPSAVTPKLDANGRKVYELHTVNGSKTIAGTAIVHIRGTCFPGSLRGMSPIAQALFEVIGIGKAAQRYAAQFYGNGANPSGTLDVPGSMTQEAADKLLGSFSKKHGGISKSHAIAVLTGGVKFNPITVNPAESQALEARKFTDVQIAHAYGIPPEFVTETEGAKGYVTALFMSQAMWLLTGINPRLVRIENALSQLLPPGVQIKFNRNAMLIMSPTERTAFYAAAQNGEWMSPDEIRAKEDMKPMGGEYAKPLKSVQWIHEGDSPPTDPAA